MPPICSTLALLREQEAETGGKLKLGYKHNVNVRNLLKGAVIKWAMQKCILWSIYLVANAAQLQQTQETLISIL